MKIFWALNPFDRNQKLAKKSASLVRMLMTDSTRLEAVFVASPGCVQLATAFDIPRNERFGRYPKTLMDQAIKKLGLKIDKSTVISESSTSTTKSVRALADYLASKKADLTLLASRAQSGLPRMILGSFAETLVHFSKVDLLVLNENSAINRGGMRHLLFAHDFSSAADNGLERAIQFSMAWNSMLHVIHIPEPAYGFKFKGQNPEVEKYRERVRQKEISIARKLNAAGVFGSILIEPRWSQVSTRILKRASEVDADCILVVAKSGKLMSLLGGSVSRQVLRESTKPVLVIKNLFD